MDTIQLSVLAKFLVTVVVDKRKQVQEPVVLRDDEHELKHVSHMSVISSHQPLEKVLPQDLLAPMERNMMSHVCSWGSAMEILGICRWRETFVVYMTIVL